MKPSRENERLTGVLPYAQPPPQPPPPKDRRKNFLAISAILGVMYLIFSVFLHASAYFQPGTDD